MVAATGPEDGFEPEEDPAPPPECRPRSSCTGAVAGQNRALVMFPAKESVMPAGLRAAVPFHLTRATRRFSSSTARPTPSRRSRDPRLRFADKLEEVGVEHQLVIVEGCAHSFDLQPCAMRSRELVVGFFDKHLRGGKP